MNTTVLRFDGGAIPAGGGASSDRAIHHLFLRELTITELGQEVSVYALLDLDRPTLVTPNYEPVSAFTLYDWCSRGDVLQVDVAEALETGTNTYSAFFESANVATNNDGSYVDECVIRVDTKLSGTTPKINTRYIHLSQILDEGTSIAYMCQHTTLNDHVTYGDSLRRTGKVHFLKAVGDELADVRAPYGFWIVDLEKPNPQSPYGYDYAMAEEVIAQLSAGEVFVLSTYRTAPSAEEDLYIMGSSALQSREGHQAVRIWFTRMFAATDPEYMYFTTIYTPSMYNDNPLAGGYPEGRMAILNWRGQQDSRSEFHFMPYTELADVATSGSYNDLRNKPSIPAPQVQSDWAQTNTSAVDYIKNKPSIPAAQVQSDWTKTDTGDPAYIKHKPNLAAVATSGDYADLSNKPTIPAAQVQSDWNQTNSRAVSFIKNKPSIPAAQVQSDWSQSNSSAVDYIKNKPNLASVATSGSYNDLSNKPTIPAAQVQSDWNQSNSQAVDFIKNKPTIPSAQVQSDWSQTNTSAVDYIKNKPTIPAAQVQSNWSQTNTSAVDYIKNKPNLALKENVSNKVQTIDPTSETEYPSSYAVAGLVNGIYTIINDKIQRGLNTSQTNSLAYSLVGTLKVTDSNKRGMMGFELFCCKQCSKPIRMHATFGYQADNNLNASYSVEASVNSELARYKLSWRFANDHTAAAPKIEIWLIDTIDTGADTRRCGCVVHMVSGIEWIDGTVTTDTLPSDLTDFKKFYT